MLDSSIYIADIACVMFNTRGRFAALKVKLSAAWPYKPKTDSVI
jgi:hypothetical protein